MCIDTAAALKYPLLSQKLMGVKELSLVCGSVIIPLGVQCCTERWISSLANSNENLQAVTSELFSPGPICDCPEICIWRCGQVCSAALAFVLSREPCSQWGRGMVWMMGNPAEPHSQGCNLGVWIITPDNVLKNECVLQTRQNETAVVTSVNVFWGVEMWNLVVSENYFRKKRHSKKAVLQVIHPFAQRQKFASIMVCRAALRASLWTSTDCRALPFLVLAAASAGHRVNGVLPWCWQLWAGPEPPHVSWGLSPVVVALQGGWTSAGWARSASGAVRCHVGHVSSYFYTAGCR